MLELLRDACKKGSLQKLKDNLKICQEQDIDPFSNSFSTRPETLFHIASESKTSGLEILEELVTEFRYWSSKTHRKYKGSGINSYLRDSLNSEGYTALHCACKSNKSDYVYVFVKELRFYGVYCRSCKRVPFECKCISFEMMYKYTPFEVACLHCCSDIALFLLKKCQRVFGDFSNGIILAYDSGFRDFIISVCRKHKVTVKVLNSLCRHERFEIVDFCIREHLCKQEGKQLVHMAASNDEVDLLRYCAKKKGFDIASVDKSGVNILHIACSADKIECVKFVLESNYLLLAVKKNKKGERPINLSESEEIIELIKSHLRLNPLHLFCLCHESSFINKTELRTLTQHIHHDCISKQDAVGNTPLHYACENGQVSVVEIMLSHTSSLDLMLQNDDGDTAAHLLVCHLSKAIKEFYAVDKFRVSQPSNNLNRKNNFASHIKHIITSLENIIKHSSFNFSLCNKKGETVAFLILTQLVLTDKRFDDLLYLIPNLVQKSYDSKWFSNDFLRIISHYCQHCYQKSRSKRLKKNSAEKPTDHPFVKLLKDTTSPEFMLDSTIRDSEGNTCLHYAATCNWSELVIYLVTSTKFDVSIKNQDDKKTPLQCIKPLCQNISSLLESCSIYEHLIENGAQINFAPVDKNANTILHIACIAKSHKLLKRLIELDDTKKMVVAVNKAGKTPLHLLCSRSNYFVSVECFELLLKVPDVDVMCRTKSGRTPLEILTENVIKKLIVHERIRKSVCLIVQHDTFKPEMYIKPEYLEIWCKIGKTEFMEQIISSDETLVNRVNDHNQNLLHFACFNFDSDVFDFLLQYKSSAKLFRASDRFGFSPFHCIGWRVWKNNFHKMLSFKNFSESEINLMSFEKFIASDMAHNLLEIIEAGLPVFCRYKRSELIEAILNLPGIDPNLRNCFWISEYKTATVKDENVGNHPPLKLLGDISLLDNIPLQLNLLDILDLNPSLDDNITIDERDTELHKACKKAALKYKENHSEIIKELSEPMSDINVQNKNGLTPFHCYCSSKMSQPSDGWQYLVSHPSFNPNVQDNAGCTVLHYICDSKSPNIPLVKELLMNEKTNIDLKNSNGNTCFHLIAPHNSELISLFQDQNPFCLLLNPIHELGEGDLHCLQVCTLSGSPLANIDSKQNTPLHIACRAVCPPFIKKLLQKCKKHLSMDFPTNESYQTPLHMLALGVSHHESSGLQLDELRLPAQRKKLQHLRTHDWYLLLKCGINKQDDLGNTALHYTCQSQNTLLLKALTMSKLCDFSIRNNAGELPLTIAMKTGSRSFFLKVLIKYFESQ